MEEPARAARSKAEEHANFRLLDGEEEQRVARTTVEMLKRFHNDQAVAAAEREFEQAQAKEAAFVKDFGGLDATCLSIGSFR
jgi:hypothetical protein